MSEIKKTKQKRAPVEEPSAIQESPFEIGLFANRAAEKKAIQLLGTSSLEWACIVGGAYVRFLTNSGAFYRVHRETGHEG